MTTPSTTSDSGTEHANLTVSAEFRDAVRVAKAKQGLTYEDYLRQYLPDDIEGTA
jgi:predicted DNA binding CopG/RHH family protein